MRQDFWNFMIHGGLYPILKVSFQTTFRCDQYRQMTGGRFLVALKDTICSEKILKIKCLLKNDIDIDEEIKVSCPWEMEIMKLKTSIFYEFHWPHSCFRLIEVKLLYILQAILQRNIWKKSRVAPVVKCILRFP